jgi:group I intron endonuclease
MKLKTCGIYCIESPTGRVYTGKSKDIAERFRDYRRLVNCKKQPAIYRSLLKYGVENHKFIIIEELPNATNEELNLWETIWIARFRAFGFTVLNLTDGGDGGATSWGRKMTDKNKKALSEANRGRKFSHEHKAKLSAAWVGRVVSDETKQKISKALTGKKISEETREKYRKRMIGNKMPAETREKIRITRTGRKHSPESIAKMTGRIPWNKNKKLKNEIPVIRYAFGFIATA